MTRNDSSWGHFGFKLLDPQCMTLSVVGPYLEDLARALFMRRQEAAFIRFEDRGTGLQLEAQDSHNNVDAWCRFNSGHKPIRGWFVIELPALRKTLFVSHSVVEDEQGRRFDPKPRRFYNEYPFLEDEDPLYQLRGLLSELAVSDPRVLSSSCYVAHDRCLAKDSQGER